MPRERTQHAYPPREGAAELLGSAKLTRYICGQADRSYRLVLANIVVSLPQLDIDYYSTIFTGNRCCYTRLHGRALLGEMDSVLM